MKKKTLINRICTLMCALVVMVGIFGGTMGVYASESDDVGTDSSLSVFLKRVGLYDAFIKIVSINNLRRKS